MARPWDLVSADRVLQWMRRAKQLWSVDVDALRDEQVGIDELVRYVEGEQQADAELLDLTVEVSDQPDPAPDDVWDHAPPGEPYPLSFDMELLDFAKIIARGLIGVVLAVLVLVSRATISGTEGRDVLVAVAVLVVPLLAPIVRHFFPRRPGDR